MTQFSYMAVPGFRLKPTLTSLLKNICNYYGLEDEEIKTKSRKQEYVEKRRLFCYLAEKRKLATLQKIGGLVGYDHATVLHHCHVVNNLIETNKQFKKEIETLEKIL